MLRLSQHRSVTIVRSYSDDDRQAEASNCDVWLLYGLIAHAAVCVSVEMKIRGSRKERKVCVAAQELSRGQLPPNCGAHRAFTIICLCRVAI